jgi:hypothetical protein
MKHAAGTARKFQLQYPGAIYHLTSRGDREEPVFLEDADRRILAGDQVLEVRQLKGL